MVSFPGLRLSQGSEWWRKEHVSARRHLSGCSGIACSEADPAFGWEPQKRPLAVQSKSQDFPRLRPLLGPPTAPSLPPEPFPHLQMVGRAAAGCEVTMVTGDSRQPLPPSSRLADQPPAPSLQPPGSRRTAGPGPAHRLPLGLPFRGRFLSGSPDSKAGFRAEANGHKHVPGGEL